MSAHNFSKSLLKKEHIVNAINHQQDTVLAFRCLLIKIRPGKLPFDTAFVSVQIIRLPTGLHAKLHISASFLGHPKVCHRHISHFMLQCVDLRMHWGMKYEIFL